MKSSDLHRQGYTVVFLWLLMIASSAWAQDSTAAEWGREPECWGRGSIGKTYFGPTFSADLSYGWQGNILSLRYLSADEFSFSPGGGPYDEPAPKVRAFGLLYGRALRTKSLVLSLLAVLGYVDDTDRGREISGHTFEATAIKGFYLPVEGEARIEVSNTFAFVISAVGMVTGNGVYAGGMLGIAIGRF